MTTSRPLLVESEEIEPLARIRETVELLLDHQQFFAQRLRRVGKPLLQMLPLAELQIGETTLFEPQQTVLGPNYLKHPITSLNPATPRYRPSTGNSSVAPASYDRHVPPGMAAPRAPQCSNPHIVRRKCTSGNGVDRLRTRVKVD